MLSKISGALVAVISAIVVGAAAGLVVVVMVAAMGLWEALTQLD